LDNHLRSVRCGDGGLIDYNEDTLDQYVGLSEEYNVPINPDKLKTSMKDQINSENLNAGVTHLITAIKEALRTANYSGVSAYSHAAENFRHYVHVHSLGGLVDFTEMDKYLTETATNTPRLTEST
jgi:hypothetical protein